MGELQKQLSSKVLSGGAEESAESHKVSRNLFYSSFSSSPEISSKTPQRLCAGVLYSLKGVGLDRTTNRGAY